MNEKLLSLFREGRTQGMAVTSALRYAKWQNKGLADRLDWEDRRGRQTAKWSEHGWDFVAQILPDDDSGIPDYLGEFTDEWEPGAIDNWKMTHHSDYQDHGVYHWFVPCNSYQGHYDSLRAMYFSRHEAHTLALSYVLQDYERARTMGDDWIPTVLRVTVYRTGIKLGHESVCGIESDADMDYFTETAMDLATSALAEAKAVAKGLFADFVEADRKPVEA